MEKKKDLTPAQKYMAEMITALTTLIEAPERANIRVINKLLLKRPKTLRSAIYAALYKSGIIHPEIYRVVK